jgi:hypothetical protein
MQNKEWRLTAEKYKGILTSTVRGVQYDFERREIAVWCREHKGGVVKVFVHLVEKRKIE